MLNERVQGRVFVADTDNNRIRGIHVCESSDGSVAKEDPEGTAKRCSDDQIIKRLLGTKAAAKQALEVQLVIVAGSGEPGLRDGPAHAARFDSPTGLAVRGGRATSSRHSCSLLTATMAHSALLHSQGAARARARLQASTLDTLPCQAYGRCVLAKAATSISLTPRPSRPAPEPPRVHLHLSAAQWLETG